MEESPRLSSRVNQATAPYSSSPARRDESSLPPSVHRELNLARTTKANLLLVGREPVVLSLVSLLLPEPNAGATVRRQDGRLLLPSASSRGGAVVVRDVDALTREEQRSLIDWLDSASTRTQVISTASVPLLPLVETCQFNDALYYRLNTVYIDVSR